MAKRKGFFENIGPWYMLRLRMFPFFLQDLFGWNIFFHLFLHSDKDVPHDHPWDSYSILLWGNIHELRQEDVEKNNVSIIDGTSVDFIEYETDRLPLFKPKFRKAEYRHVIKLNSRSAFTIFIPLKKKRTWYFYPDGEPVLWWIFLDGESRKVKLE